jgi:hypothetical protein
MADSELKQQPTAPGNSLESHPEQSQNVPGNSYKFTRTGSTNTMPKSTKNPVPHTLILAVIVVLLGIGSGYGLSKVSGKDGFLPSSSLTTPSAEQDVTVGEMYGSKGDVFADDATGVIIAAGVNGEGTHRLLREGGESQTICLTSSVLDLDLFENARVKVWGETFDAQKCAWFMDVGRVQVEELNAEKPFEVEE